MSFTATSSTVVYLNPPVMDSERSPAFTDCSVCRSLPRNVSLPMSPSNQHRENLFCVCPPTDALSFCLRSKQNTQVRQLQAYIAEEITTHDRKWCRATGVCMALNVELQNGSDFISRHSYVHKVRTPIALAIQQTAIEKPPSEYALHPVGLAAFLNRF